MGRMHWRTIPVKFLLGTMFVILALMVWAAQPWGANFYYQDLRDYLSLAAMMAWAAAPFLALAFLFRQPARNQAQVITSTVITAVICTASLYLTVDAMFIAPDAQGGLIFIALPFYQWAGVVIAFIIRVFNIF
jgi:hypothetical protein